MMDSGNISEMKSLASDDEEEDAENARLEGRWVQWSVKDYYCIVKLAVLKKNDYTNKYTDI